MWLSAIMSAGTIIDIALGIAATKATECTIFLEFTEDLKEEIIDACFKPHSNISALLPFYILSHVFILLHLLTSNYGFPKEDVLSDTMNDNNEPIYVQAPAPVPPPQPANYNKFY
ncbi:hypothetical protein GPJ56_009865 [Histomonas meleagridis]|uniref:uncharacterized protein n=1 Tax=Histomonas meleagridis TaxID=135588 RepID=UPI00355A05CA|nr:hypothetical protein GPJ56_009865 [Histomonas meleagridis]KAH0802828.1 hypothetical protein GO595_004335 [Histomonas meleagridis]